MAKRKGIGDAGMTVLRSIRDGRQSDREVRLALKPFCSGEAAVALLQSMRNAGYISRNRGGRWHLTMQGRGVMPEPVQQVPMRPYVAPKRAPVRPGAMAFASLPSVAAGVERAWRHPI